MYPPLSLAASTRRASTPISGCSASPSSRSRRCRPAIEIIVDDPASCARPACRSTRMPIFAWYMLVTALMMLFGFPPLILGSILLELERAFDLPFFDPDARRRPAAVAAPVLAVRPPRGLHHLPAGGRHACRRSCRCSRGASSSATAGSCVGIVALAFLSFGLWVHHMFTVGIPHLALAFFSAASTAVAVPTAVQIFAWLGTLAPGGRSWKLPMLYHLRLLLRLRDGRPDRRHAGDRAVRLAGARHLFRRRASALRAGRRLRVPDARGGSTTGCRCSPDARRAPSLAVAGVLADLHRLQPDLLLSCT